MIKYMIIGLPRSRTTWFANLLTTGNSICLHDPLSKWSIGQINNLYPDKYLGIADTSLYLTGVGFINSLPYKKVIIHRNYIDVCKSLGLAPVRGNLSSIEGLHIEFDEIDDRIQQIWEYCLDIPFDAERCELLKDYNVQPHFDGMTPANQDRIKDFVSMINA